MSDHEPFLELCSLSILGGLEPEERSRLESHLDAGCAICDAELARCAEFAAELAETAMPLSPRAEVKSRLFDRIDLDLSVAASIVSDDATAGGDESARQQPWREWARDDAKEHGIASDSAQSATGADLFFKAGSDGDWEPTGVDGIEVRSLFVDRANDRMTALFRMEPGASYVPHRHAGHEECFVVQGDLRVGDIVMHAGDYQRASEGSIHGEQSTEGGCVLLISSSMTDEIV